MLSNAKHPKALIALIAVTVVAILAVAVVETSQTQLFAGATSSTDASAVLPNDYSAHLDNIHGMNTSSIAQDYTQNASVQFNTPGQPSTGNYTGRVQIARLYGADLFPLFAVPSVSELNSTVHVDGSKATVDSTFLINGYDSDANPEQAMVTSHAIYLHQGNEWLISYETWNFVFPPSTG